MENSLNKKFLSIISASNRPHNMRAFLANLNQTLDDPDCLEVLVKIDDGDIAMRSLMEESVKIYPFEIRWIETPRLDGYYTLHFGYQQLFEMSCQETYFIFPVNEEVRFKTKGWDKVLRTYQNFFEDDLFRLKISRLKYRNYYSVHECGPTPENYPFMTRKWVELAGGLGDCWGPDGWFQYIDYHLGQTEGVEGIPGLFRSVPIHTILIEGEEAGKELTVKQIKIRSHRIFQEWWRMYRTEAQLEFRRIASRMFAYVWARHEQMESFTLEEDCKLKKFIIKNSNGQIKKEICYSMNAILIKLENFRFLVKMARSYSVGSLTAFIYPSYGQKKGIKKWLNYPVRYVLVLCAVLLSFFSVHDESVHKKASVQLYLRMRKLVRLLVIRVKKRSLSIIKNRIVQWKKLIYIGKRRCRIKNRIVQWKKLIYIAKRRCRIIAGSLANLKKIIKPISKRLLSHLKYYSKKFFKRIYYPNPLKGEK